MNRIILMGRLTRDPEIYYKQGDSSVPVARYSLAVDRKKKRDDGVTADFFNVVAFDKQATFAERYLYKGAKIVMSGFAQTGTYERDGDKKPFFEVVVLEQEFAESRAAENRHKEEAFASLPAVSSDGFMEIPDDFDELPFN